MNRFDFLSDVQASQTPKKFVTTKGSKFFSLLIECNSPFMIAISGSLLMKVKNHSLPAFPSVHWDLMLAVK